MLHRDTVVDGIRRETLRPISQALVEAAAGDELRQAVIDQAAALVDALVQMMAMQTAGMSGREARTAAEIVFVQAWPIVSQELVPALVAMHGGTAKAAEDVRRALQRQSVERAAA